MNSSMSLKLLCMGLGIAFVCQAQEIPSQHFDLVKLADGVYAAIDRPGGSAVSNAGIVDLGDAVLVFDTFMSLEAAGELARKAKKLSRNAVRYVVNSHYHKDHTWGNQVFSSQATVISSNWTREALLRSKVPDVGKQVKELNDEIAGLRSKTAIEKDQKEKREMLLSIGFYQAFLDSYRELRITPASLGVDRELTIYGSKRTAKLVVTGGGSTGGDLYVFLPEDRIVFAGDVVMLGMHPYLSESDPEKWIASLATMQKLRVMKLVPGHGPVADSTAIVTMIDYLESIRNFVALFRRDKRPIEEFGIDAIPEQFRSWCYGDIYKKNLKYVSDLVTSERR